jgi:hypothetical protein
VTILTVAGLGTDPVVLEVPEVGGAVRISGGREPRERTILMAGGMALPLRMLDRFVGRTVIDGDDLVLPNMAPGGYLLCAVAPDGDRACSEAHLPAGSGITLTLPDEPPAPERSFR